MKWIEIVKSEFIKVGVNRLTNALVGLLLLPLLSSFVFPQVFATISWQLYLAIVTVLSIALMSVLTAYLSLRRKYVTPFKGWKFDQKTGIWSDGEYDYCHKCKLDGKQSHLKSSDDCWKCSRCGSAYANPSYKPEAYILSSLKLDENEDRSSGWNG